MSEAPGPHAIDDSVQTPAEALASALTQHGVTVAELSRQQQVLLVFLRHMGCTFCREALSDLAKRREAIQHGGTQIALVHMSADHEAQPVFSMFGLGDVARISDPERRLYKAMGLEQGRLGQLAGPAVWLRGLAASAPRWLGGGGHWPGRIAGDALQLPGVFVIHDGKIVKAHRNQTAGERPDYTGLACEMGNAER